MCKAKWIYLRCTYLEHLLDGTPTSWSFFKDLSFLSNDNIYPKSTKSRKRKSKEECDHDTCNNSTDEDLDGTLEEDVFESAIYGSDVDLDCNDVDLDFEVMNENIERVEIINTVHKKSNMHMANAEIRKANRGFLMSLLPYYKKLNMKGKSNVRNKFKAILLKEQIVKI